MENLTTQERAVLDIIFTHHSGNKIKGTRYAPTPVDIGTHKARSKSSRTLRRYERAIKIINAAQGMERAAEMFDPLQAKMF